MHAASAAALVLALALAGCAGLGRAPPPAPVAVEAAIEAGRLREADALLARLREARPEDPAIPALERVRSAAAARLRARAAAAVRAAETRGRWREALAALEAAERELPDDPRLKALRGRLEQARREALAALDCRLRGQEAEALAARLPLLERRAALLADELEAQAAPAEARRRLEALRGPLLACVRMALAHGEDERAARLLALARAAGAAGPEAEALAARLRARREAAARARAERREAERAARLRAALGRAMERARAALAAGRLAEALEAAREARRLAPDDREVRALAGEVEAAARRRADALKREGQRLYAAGRVEAALARWREAHRLAPDDTELARWVERAERVLARLRRLRPAPQAAP